MRPMELKEVLRFADEKVFAKTGKHLEDLQEAMALLSLWCKMYLIIHLLL